MGLTERFPRGRVVGLMLVLLLAAGAIAAMNIGMVSCQTRAQATRPLTAAEVKQLASMRMRNWGDGRTGISGTIGGPGKQTRLKGWVDWRRALIYLSASAPTSSALVQAKPGIIAVRPGEGTSPAAPPLPPPADGWRVRPIALSGEHQSPMDNLVAFLFVIARDGPDNTDLLSPLKNQWVRRDSAEGTQVNVLLGPAVLPETTVAPSPSRNPSAGPSPSEDPNSLEAHGGAVGYWLDADGRLRRIETLLAENMPTTIDFHRDDRPDFEAIDALGGGDLSPRAVTRPEATLISAVRQRDYRAHGAAITVTLPVMPGALRQARGWIDWQRGLTYLSVQDVDDPSFDVLLHANRGAVSLHKTDGRAPDTPPLPAPKSGWDKAEWSELSGTPELTDLDLLIYEALFMGTDQLDDAARIQAGARMLRVDVLDGVPVGVFELPSALEQQAAPAGLARMRYWLDNSGVLRRLEVRTATGGFAQLDLDLGAKLPAGLPSSVG